MSHLLRPLAIGTLIAGGTLLGVATPAVATVPAGVSALVLAIDDDRDDPEDRDDDRDDGGAPRGGIDTGAGGSAPARGGDDDDDDDDDDDRDDGGAPRGGVETGAGGTAGVDLLPLGLGGAALAGGVTFVALRRRRGGADS